MTDDRSADAPGDEPIADSKSFDPEVIDPDKLDVEIDDIPSSFPHGEPKVTPGESGAPIPG